MKIFKESDVVLDAHPSCKEKRIGIIIMVTNYCYAVSFPNWSYPVRREWEHVKSFYEVQDLMKEIL